MIRVRVQEGRTGYYDHKRRYGAGVQNREQGDVFNITCEKEFSSKWMEKVKGAAPIPVTDITEEIKGAPENPSQVVVDSEVREPEVPTESTDGPSEGEKAVVEE